MTGSAPRTLTRRLRHGTEDLHRQIESEPFGRALAEGLGGGASARRTAVLWTRGLLRLHRALDAWFDRVEGADALPETLRPLRRAPILEADIEALGSEALGDEALVGAASDGGSVEEGAVEFAPEAHIASLPKVRGALVGVCYIVEGSANGGALLTRRLAGVAGNRSDPQAGLRHLVPRGSEQAVFWRRWKAEADQLGLDDDETRVAIEAARALFRCYGDLHRALAARVGDEPAN